MRHETSIMLIGRQCCGPTPIMRGAVRSTSATGTCETLEEVSGVPHRLCVKCERWLAPPNTRSRSTRWTAVDHLQATTAASEPGERRIDQQTADLLIDGRMARGWPLVGTPVRRTAGGPVTWGRRASRHGRPAEGRPPNASRAPELGEQRWLTCAGRRDDVESSTVSGAENCPSRISGDGSSRCPRSSTRDQSLTNFVRHSAADACRASAQFRTGDRLASAPPSRPACRARAII